MNTLALAHCFIKWIKLNHKIKQKLLQTGVMLNFINLAVKSRGVKELGMNEFS